MSQTPFNPPEKVDQLVLVVVADEQAGDLGKLLVANGFRFTVISASSGLLPAGTSCLMLGIHSSLYSRLIALVEKVCKTRRRFIPAHVQFGLTEGLPLNMIEAEIGSANVYTLPVESYEIF